MSETSNLSLGLVAAGQAQKHVTVNEALVALDAVVQIGVLGRGLADPPDTPAPGERHIPAPGAGGVWAGHDGEIAAFQAGAWRFYPPRPGWLAYVADEQALIVWDGAAWAAVTTAGGQPYSGEALQNVALLGIGTEADAVNPFAAKLNKALWTAKPVAEGGDGDLRYTLSKESAGNFVSLLFQSGYEARAEFGLLENDELTLKVSDDGTTWRDALVIAPETARVSLPNGVDIPGLGLATKNVSQAPAFTGTRPGDNLLTGAMLAAGAMVEYGSNANGSYWRWESGLQICTHVFTMNLVASTVIYGSWTYPAVFSSPPNVTGLPIQGAGADIAPTSFNELRCPLRRATSNVTSGLTVAGDNGFSAGAFLNASMSAIGVWK